MGPHPFRQVWCPIRLVSRCIEEHIKAYGLSIGLNVLQTHFRESFFDVNYNRTMFDMCVVLEHS